MWLTMRACGGDMCRVREVVGQKSKEDIFKSREVDMPR